MNPLDEFTLELRQLNASPERLALAIALIVYPAIEIDEYLKQLDDLADFIDQHMDRLPFDLNPAQQFMQVFHDELGFTGSRDNYYHPDNSCLNHVLEKREGLPIMLCLVCVAVGRRIGLNIEGVGFPGHFMARFRHQGDEWLLDPFNGEVLAPSEAAQHLARIFGRPLTLSDENYRPFTPVEWAQRILFNLRNVYLGRHEILPALRVLDYLLLLMPNHAVLWRERGILRHQSEQWEPAIHDLRRAFFLFGQGVVIWGAEEERQILYAKLNPEEQRIVQIYHRLLEMRTRFN